MLFGRQVSLWMAFHYHELIADEQTRAASSVREARGRRSRSYTAPLHHVVLLSSLDFPSFPAYPDDAIRTEQ